MITRPEKKIMPVKVSSNNTENILQIWEIFFGDKKYFAKIEVSG